MRLVNPADITVRPNRQRQDFDPKALQELADSIEQLGLMHAPVVRDGNILVAGERRLRAIALIRELGGNIHYHNSEVPHDQVPVVDLGELSELEAREAELDENIKRRDLTWQELAAATEELHSLRNAQRISEGRAPQTFADTAMELSGRSDGAYQDSIRQKVIVAAHLSDPDVAAAKSLPEAFKVLKRKEEVERNTALAVSVGTNYSAASHTLVNADCLDWMSSAEPAQFDVIVTDPPYGMGADDFGDAAGKLTTITHEYKDDYESFSTLIRSAAVGISRVAKPAAHLYVFCDIDNFHFLKSLFAKSEYGGWSVFRTPLILQKVNSGRVPLPEHGPRRTYECILYAFRGGKRTTAIYPDVISAPGDDNLGHGAQKPVAVFSDLLRRSARPGDRCFDPFAGTGTILPAAHGLRLYATAIEKEKSYYGIACKRLEGIDIES